MNNFVLNLSDQALKRAQEILKCKPNGSFLRVEIVPGGCQGFNTKFSLDTIQNDDDVVFTKNDISYVSDQTSLKIIDGSTIEYSSSLMGAFFWLNVIKSESTCSCGSSFSISSK